MAPHDMSEEKKSQALQEALDDIEKRYGRGAIMKLGDAKDFEVEVISTGSLALDLALGVGGLPRGRITEIYGPEGAGKSTLAYHVVAQAQKAGGIAAYIDVEHALDKDHAESCGIDVTELLISQPDTGEQALEICDALVRSNAVDVIVVDSVAALVPRAEIEGEMGDSLPGLQARLMSQALRKLTGGIARSRTAVIFINQLREKIGIVFGNPEVTPGGRALKFYSSVRIDLQRGVPEAGRHRHRQPGPGEDREEQDGASLPHGGVRYHLSRRPPGHKPGGGLAGPRGGSRDRQEAGLLLLVRGAQAGPGARAGEGLPAGGPPAHGGAGEPGPGGRGGGAARAGGRRGPGAGR